MTNFTNKITSIEFQIHSTSKITHLQVHGKDFCPSDTFADIWEQVETMIKSGKVENQQTTQGLASICFFHQNTLNLKSLLVAFLISHAFSPITGSHFYHCDEIIKIQN